MTAIARVLTRYILPMLVALVITAVLLAALVALCPTVGYALVGVASDFIRFIEEIA